MWRIVIVVSLSLMLVSTAAACPWTPPQPPPPPPPPSGPPPVPPEYTPPAGPPDYTPPPDALPHDPIITPGDPPPHEPTWIEAPSPRTFSDGPSGAQKVILNGNGVYEFYGRDNVSFWTHVPAVAVDHAVHERNEFRDVVLTPGQPVEYLLPTGVTYLFKWTEQGGHEYIRTFNVGAPGTDVEINLP